jgi:hypothetical protein
MAKVLCGSGNKRAKLATDLLKKHSFYFTDRKFKGRLADLRYKRLLLLNVEVAGRTKKAKAK